MAHTSTTDEVLTGQWSIREMLAVVQSMIDEVERHVLQKESLSTGVIQGLYETINNIEAEILRRRTALSLLENQIEGYHTGVANPQKKVASHVPPVLIAYKDNDLQTSLTAEQGSTDSRTFGRQNTSKDSQSVVADEREIVDSLQDNIKAIQSVIVLRMSDTLLGKTRKTSNMVSFSILEEEMKILDDLLDRIQGVCKSSDDQVGDVLEEKLVALPAQLNALFNMEIREVAQEGSEIDEKVMMHMVVENQKRTNVLRHIELVANKVKEATRNVQDDARSLHQSPSA